MALQSSLPDTLYRAEGVRELDRLAIQGGIPGKTLMARAGEEVFTALRIHWPQARRIAVVCGVGNNAGDGFVVARLAREAGLSVSVFQVGDKLKGDALEASRAFVEAGGSIEPFPERIKDADVIVDALFGTGLDRDIEGPFREAVEAIHAACLPVLSVDIPSGLHADTGRVMGVAIRAQVTVTFIGLKQGMFTAEGPDHSGLVLFSDLGVPEAIYDKVSPSCRRLSLSPLPLRSRTAHKGDFGHVLVIGGGPGMGGAARMAGEAALRVGAGLVSLAVHPQNASPDARRPELMVHGVEHPDELSPLMERATVIALGPGLGRSSWSEGLWHKALETACPLVVDADGLNLLARYPLKRDDWVLTPHPGEAARLLATTVEEVQGDRFAAVQRIRARYGGTCVLKGAGTLIASKGLSLCASGNPGMASGGMGDVLTGVIAGLLAQGFATAAEQGVCLHGAAGDRAAEAGERGLLALDLMPHLRGLANAP